jgi:Kef-type K+ transport system membrane component KefB
MKAPEDGEHRASKKPNRTRLLGVVLLVVAVLFWVAAPAVVLFPLSAGQKVWAGSAFLVLGEVAFWVAALALGREAIRRYRRFLDPRDWLGRGRV